MKAKHVLLWFVVAFGSLGCATQGDLQKVETEQVRMKTQLSDLSSNQQRLLDDMKKAQGELVKINKVLKNFTKEGRVNFAEFDSKLDELRRDYQQLLGRYQLLESSFNKLKEQHDKLYAAYSASFGDPAAKKGDATTVQIVSTEGLFKAAKALYDNKRYEQARDRLKEFVKKYPADPYTDDAYIMIGDCFYELNSYVQASLYYNAVLKKFKTGDQVDKAYLKLGQVFFRMKDCNAGKAFLRLLIKRYPSSPYREEAREKLRNARRLCRR
ncbi:MAG: tetratricopeptide repeat protein [Myxococcales bacterium]|nr:tetratricopeptide repeat protein [Myxococcales bacterium]MCB9643046.1 tetratricopeptide repeat protein [Myxococcales bacterium]